MDWRRAVTELEAQVEQALLALEREDAGSAQRILRTSGRLLERPARRNGSEESGWQEWAIDLAVVASFCSRWIGVGQTAVAREELQNALRVSRSRTVVQELSPARTITAAAG